MLEALLEKVSIPLPETMVTDELNARRQNVEQQLAYAGITMETYLAQFGAWVTVLQGLIFVVCVLAFRRGIIGELGNLLKVKL